MNSVSSNNQTPTFMPIQEESSEEKAPNLSSRQNTLSEHLINSLNALDAKIDEGFPQNVLQMKIDRFASQVKEKFSSLEGFDEWLQENNATEWYSQLAVYLIKLPPKAAWNVVTALHSLFGQALYMAVHPVKGLNSLAKNTIILLNELTKSENWAKMGAGSIGVLTAQGMILGGPISLIGLGIGGALIAGGVSVEILSAAFEAEEGKEFDVILNKMKVYAKQLPEALLTGVFTGLLIGGIRRAFTSTEQPIEINEKTHVETNFKEISDVAEYGNADWNNLIKIERGITLEQAKTIASTSADIDYFFFTKGLQMVIGDPTLENIKIFHYGDTAFFSGEPWWGSAPGFADGFIKI